MEPRFKHDCDKCIYLGESQGFYDLYYCPTHHDLIARYGDDGPEYMSISAEACVRFNIGIDDIYTEIYHRAKVKGLL